MPERQRLVAVPHAPSRACLLGLLLLGLGAAGAAAQDEAPPPEGGFGVEAWQAKEEGVPVRSDPGFLYRTLRNLRRGQEILVDRRQGQWLHVRPEGWVLLEHVTRSGAAPASPGPGSGTRLVVVRSGARVRQGPGTGYDVLETLEEGATVDAISAQDGWWRLASGGYLFEGLVRPEAVPGAAPAPVGAWEVAASSANVRSGRGTAFPVVARHSRGDRVTVSQVVDGWCEIAGEGWVRQDLLRPTGAAAAGGSAAPGPVAAAVPGGPNGPVPAAKEPARRVGRSWTLMDLNGVLFEVGEMDPGSEFIAKLRKEMRATGVLEEDWTFLRLVIGVPPGKVRFNYSPDHNTTVVVDKSGARYGNVYARGPLERLPAHLRDLFAPRLVEQGEVFEALLMFRPTLKVEDIHEVSMSVGGRLQALYPTE